MNFYESCKNVDKFSKKVVNIFESWQKNLKIFKKKFKKFEKKFKVNKNFDILKFFFETFMKFISKI